MSKPTVAQLRTLIGNPNAYALQNDNGTYTPVREPLHNGILKRHLKEEITVGTYIVKGDEARTLILDVDSGNKAEDDAYDLADALRELGIPERSTGVEYSGKKGYHVWVPVASYVPANWLRRLGRAAVTISGVDCEVYPKQDRVSDLGNLCKLPGSIHRSTGKRNDFVGPPPQVVSRAIVDMIVSKLPEDKKRSSGGRVALQCMEEIQNGVSEGGRNHSLFHLATMLRRSSVADEYVDMVVRQVNQRFEPPLPEMEVDALLISSQRSGPICATLPKEVQCEDCPIRQPKGLFLRPGQISKGAKGEFVVVQVADRQGDLVDIEHPDGKGYVKVAPPHRS